MKNKPAAIINVGNQSIIWIISLDTLPGFSIKGDHIQAAPRTPPSHNPVFTYKLKVKE